MSSMPIPFKWPARPALPVVMGPEGVFHVGRQARIRVPTASVPFAVQVVEDLSRMDETEEGVQVIEACEAIDRLITIAALEAPIDPPNGLIEPLDRVAATRAGLACGEFDAAGRALLGTGVGADSIIRYNPAEWPWANDPLSPPGWRVLLALLRQALVLARGEDEPGDDRACPAPGIVR
jgi:hypothetical protein